MTTALKKTTALAQINADFKADPAAAITNAFGDELSLDDLDAISAAGIDWNEEKAIMINFYPSCATRCNTRERRQLMRTF